MIENPLVAFSSERKLAMKRKQKAAYVLALLLGFLSVFGGVSLPMIHSVNAAQGATPAGTYHHNSSSLYAVYFENTEEDGTIINASIDYIQDFGENDHYDTITTDDGKTYVFNGVSKSNSDGAIEITATFTIFGDAKQDIEVVYTSTDTVTATSKKIKFLAPCW